jgi:3-hydroxyacyl-CoA dehydrogenase
MELHSGENRSIPPMPAFSRYGTTGMETLAPFSRVGIMGASETGMGMAAGLLESDIPVTVFELAREPLDLATASMRSAYQEAVSDGELTAAQRDRRVALLAATINLHHLKDCDVIVDALCADTAVKDGMLRRLNELARPGAVLITCVTGADATAEVGRIAALMRFPGDVVGMRRSNGAGQWELVPFKGTSERALETASRVVQRLGM